MWAQLITMRLKPGREDDLPRVYEQLRAIEQPGTGLLRTMAMRDQKDPSRVYNFVVFESEEKARAREPSPHSRTRRSCTPGSGPSDLAWPSYAIGLCLVVRLPATARTLAGDRLPSPASGAS